MIGAGASKITVEIGGKVLGSLGASLRGAQMQVSSFGRNVNRTMTDASKSFKNVLRNDAFQLAAVGAAGIGVALTTSVRAAAQFETSLTDISKTAGLTADETQRMGQEIMRLTGRNETNQSAEQLAAGIKTLTGRGLGLKEAMTAIRDVGRVATATGSDITDVADTSYQLMQNLNVSAKDVGKTFEVLALAGKRGSFELKDMATYFPTVASSANSLGVTGVKGAASLAAALQVVRRGAGDASTAANNLVNLLQKIQSPDAVKNFKKYYNVDLKRVIQDAQKKGLNPLEETIKEIQRVTGGDQFKVSQLFGDMQVKNALMPLLRDFKDYEKIRDEALMANGVITEDYKKQLETFVETSKTFSNVINRLQVAFGNALLPTLSKVSMAIIPLIERFADWTQKNKEFTTVIAGISTAFVGIVALLPFIASAASLFSSLSAAIGGAGGIGAVLAGIGTALTGPVGITIAAIVGIGAALVWVYTQFEWFRNATNTVFKIIGDAISGIIAAYMQVFQGIGQIFSGVWDLVVGIFSGNEKLIDSALNTIQIGFMNVIGGVINGYKAAWGWLFVMTMDFAKRLPGMILSAIVNLPTTIGNVLRGIHYLELQLGQRITEGIKWVFNQLVEQVKQTPARLASVGQAIIDAIINGLKGRAPALFNWVTGAWSKIKGLVGQGGGGDAPAQPPGRATGGGVRAGMPYIVGERRPELFVPGMNGAIVPRVARPVTAAALASLLAAPMPAAAAPAAAPVMINAPVTIHAAGGDPHEIRRQVELAFVDIQRQAESGHRVLLND